MCKEISQNDLHYDDVPLLSQEENDNDANVQQPQVYKFPLNLLLICMESLAGAVGNERMMTPLSTKVVIGWVHHMRHPTSIPDQEIDAIVHRWFKNDTGQLIATPFNERQKSFDEIIELLKSDCQLDDILISGEPGLNQTVVQQQEQ